MRYIFLASLLLLSGCYYGPYGYGYGNGYAYPTSAPAYRPYYPYAASRPYYGGLPAQQPYYGGGQPYYGGGQPYYRGGQPGYGN